MRVWKKSQSDSDTRYPSGLSNSEAKAPLGSDTDDWTPQTSLQLQTMPVGTGVGTKVGTGVGTVSALFGTTETTVADTCSERILLQSPPEELPPRHEAEKKNSMALRNVCLVWDASVCRGVKGVGLKRYSAELCPNKVLKEKRVFSLHCCRT